MLLHCSSAHQNLQGADSHRIRGSVTCPTSPLAEKPWHIPPVFNAVLDQTSLWAPREWTQRAPTLQGGPLPLHFTRVVPWSWWQLISSLLLQKGLQNLSESVCLLRKVRVLHAHSSGRSYTGILSIFTKSSLLWNYRDTFLSVKETTETRLFPLL